METKKKIVIIGATSTIARYCARLWLQKEPVELILVGRSTERMERVRGDLRVYSPKSTIRLLQSEIIAPSSIKKIVAACNKERAADLVLIAHGLLPDQKRCQEDLEYNWKTLCVNALSPALFAEAFVASMRYGTIAIIGSVAGDRGRQSNYVYGAAKGLIDRYVQGLQHRLAIGDRSRDVNMLLIKPGPTATPMTSEIQATRTGFAPVSRVASDIVVAIEKKKKVLYTPGKWKLIMHVIRHMPDMVFHRLHI